MGYGALAVLIRAESRDESRCREVAMQPLYKGFDIMHNSFHT
jgi:hypothetical protein